MKTLHNNYCNSKQGYLPLFLSDCLDLLDPVLTFDRLMGGIDLNKYLTDIPEYTTGRLRYNPVNMLKTVLFGFMTSGYCSLRELEDNCKVNIRFMYLMDHQTPSYRTFGYFINEILQDKIENIFNDINHAIFNDEHVDCNISTSTAPSLKQTQTSIPGYGRRLPKSSVTSFTKKSLRRLRRLMQKSHGAGCRSQQIRSMYRII